MKRMKTIPIFLLYVLMCTINGATAESIVLADDDRCDGWSTFGNKAKDASIAKNENGIRVETIWSSESWGLGLSYQFELPPEKKELRVIRAEIRTTGKSNAKVHAGVSSKDEGNMSQDIDLAINVTHEWKVIEFPVIQMAMDFSKKFSPTVNTFCSENAQVINFFFTKATNIDSVPDTIFLRNPQLVYFDDETYVNY